MLIKHIRQLHFWICCSVTKKYCNMSIIFSFFHKIINNYYYADVFLQNQTYFWVWLWYISIPVKESHYCKINSSTQQWQKPTTILFICFFFFSQCIWKKKKLISESTSWMVSTQRGSLSLWIPCAIIWAGVQNSSDTVTKMSCTYYPKIMA